MNVLKLGFDFANRAKSINISLTQLFNHMLVLGGVGSGKSRFLEWLAEQCWLNGCAVFVLDPDGDLVENLAARVARQVVETQSKRRLKRVHLLQLSPFQTWAYDPFAFRLRRPVHPELLPSVREAWRHTTIGRIGDILQRKQGQASFDGMPRLQRVLTDVLNGVAVAVEGKRLALADAALILDFSHPLNERIMDKIEPHLPREVASDFRLLRSMKRTEDMRRETESTLNRLRSMFGPLMRAIFGRTDGASYSVYDAIQGGHLTLVNLRDSEYVSSDQTIAVGRMLIYDIITTAMTTPRELRKPCIVIIDEAADLLTPDIGRGLRRLRKYKTGIVLASQELDSFNQGDIDLRPLVQGIPDTHIYFRQTNPISAPLLVRSMFTPLFNFDALFHEMERDGGMELVPIIEHSGSKTKGTGITSGWSEDESEADGETWQTSLAEAMSWQIGRAVQNGETQQEGESHQNSKGASQRRDPKMPWVMEQERTETAGTADGTSKAKSKSHVVADSEAEGGSKTKTDGTGGSRTRSRRKAINGGTSGNESETEGWSRRFMQVRKTIRELQATGQLKMSIADQIEMFMQRLFCCVRQEAYIRIGSTVHHMKTVDVPDPFLSETAIVRSVEWLARELAEIHNYLFVPDLSLEEEERRVREFLESTEEAVDEPIRVSSIPMA